MFRRWIKQYLNPNLPCDGCIGVMVTDPLSVGTCTAGRLTGFGRLCAREGEKLVDTIVLIPVVLDGFEAEVDIDNIV